MRLGPMTTFPPACRANPQSVSMRPPSVIPLQLPDVVSWCLGSNPSAACGDALAVQRGEALPCGRAPPQLEESIGDTQRFQLFVGVACSFEVLGSPAVRGMRYADLVLVLREVRIPTLSANLLDAK